MIGTLLPEEWLANTHNTKEISESLFYSISMFFSISYPFVPCFHGSLTEYLRYKQGAFDRPLLIPLQPYICKGQVRLPEGNTRVDKGMFWKTWNR